MTKRVEALLKCVEISTHDLRINSREGFVERTNISVGHTNGFLIEVISRYLQGIDIAFHSFTKGIRILLKNSSRFVGRDKLRPQHISFHLNCIGLTASNAILTLYRST